MLFGKRDPFYPYERAILEAVVAAAPHQIAHLLRAQVRQIRHVQRSPASPEINFYPSRRGGGWSETWVLPTRSEIRLAQVTALIRGRTHTGAVHAVSGHVFSLALRPSVTRPKRAVADDITVEFESRTLPLGGRPDAALDLAPVSFTPGAPSATAGPTSRWALLMPEDIYVVSLPDADWVVLGSGPPGLLLLGRRNASGDSFCVANVEEDTVTRLAASSMSSALREVENNAL